jgi:hypothetical protein
MLLLFYQQSSLFVVSSNDLDIIGILSQQTSSTFSLNSFIFIYQQKGNHSMNVDALLEARIQFEQFIGVHFNSRIYVALIGTEV